MGKNTILQLTPPELEFSTPKSNLKLTSFTSQVSPNHPVAQSQNVVFWLNFPPFRQFKAGTEQSAPPKSMSQIHSSSAVLIPLLLQIGGGVVPQVRPVHLSLHSQYIPPVDKILQVPRPLQSIPVQALSSQVWPNQTIGSSQVQLFGSSQVQRVWGHEVARFV